MLNSNFLRLLGTDLTGNVLKCFCCRSSILKETEIVVKHKTTLITKTENNSKHTVPDQHPSFRPSKIKISKVGRYSLFTSQVAHWADVQFQFLWHEETRNIAVPLPLDGMLVHNRIPSMKQLKVLLLPLDGMLVHNRVPSMKQLKVLLLPLDGMLVYHRVPSMKQLKALLLPLHGMLVHHRVPTSIMITSTHLYVWVKREVE